MINRPHHPANQYHGIHFGALRPPRIPSNHLAANRDLNAACSSTFLSVNSATIATDDITPPENVQSPCTHPDISKAAGLVDLASETEDRDQKTSHFTACKPGRTTRSLTRAAVECATCQREPVDLCHGLFDGLLHGILWLAGDLLGQQSGPLLRIVLNQLNSPLPVFSPPLLLVAFVTLSYITGCRLLCLILYYLDEISSAVAYYTSRHIRP